MPMRKLNLRIAVACAGVLLLTGCGSKAGEAPHLAIQHEGRVKAFESFSRSELRLIAGKERFDGNKAVPAMLIALKNPGLIAQIRWIEIEYGPLKKHLGLDVSRRHFAYSELSSVRGEVSALFTTSRQKRDRDTRPEKIEQKSERLEAQLQTIEELISGASVRVVPPVAGSVEWTSPYGTKPAFEPAFSTVVQAYGTPAFDELIKRWIAEVSSRTSGKHDNQLSLEAFYQKFRPYQWAYLLYFAGFFLWLLRRTGRIASASVAMILAALALHTAGLVFRTIVLERPPVSNMYESMIYMNWTLMVIASVFSALRKNATAIAVGAALSGFVMVYSNLLPIDPGLEVLVPVLRSNYWLTIHVMTIVSSYGAFGLSMALGHRHLFLHRSGKLSPVEATASGSLMYRSIQLGVLLLGIGTVLGGVWANESWGRFWGWDPKETWALITLLAYLVIVHLRQSNRLNDFGVALGSVFGFQLVLMTWYGVNFVLGRGLHSYGAGSGGMGWIIAFLAFEALFLLYTLPKRRS